MTDRDWGILGDELDDARADRWSRLDLLEAARAIDRVTVAGNERDRGRLSTFRTHNFGLRAFLQAKLCLAISTARRAACWHINQSLFMIKLAFTSSP